MVKLRSGPAAPGVKPGVKPGAKPGTAPGIGPGLKPGAGEFDSEALETFQRWWRESGKFAGAGLALALVAVGGWKGWGYYQDKHAAEAAVHYAAFAEKIKSGDPVDADGEMTEPPPELLSEDYADTAYLSFEYLQRAHYLVEQGKFEEAADDLRWVGENAVQPMLSEIAYVRLARVLVASDKFEEALQVLDENLFSDSTTRLIEEVRGDALLQLDDTAGAISAYRAAWEASNSKPDFLRMKLESLGQNLASGAGGAR